jgi:hypothetical protein
VLSISFNKAGLFFLWRFSALVLLCGIRRSPAMFLVVPSRWWPGRCGISGETSFNKQILLWCGVIWLLVLSPLSGHGGAERGGTTGGKKAFNPGL